MGEAEEGQIRPKEGQALASLCVLESLVNPDGSASGWLKPKALGSDNPDMNLSSATY